VKDKRGEDKGVPFFFFKLGLVRKFKKNTPKSFGAFLLILYEKREVWCLTF